MFELVCVIIIGVYNCNESCGVYYKFEFLNCDDVNFLKIMMVKFEGEGNVLVFYYEDVDILLIKLCKCDYFLKYDVVVKGEEKGDK